MIKIDRWLGEAERSIALLERSQPRNLRSEQARLVAAWEAGRRGEPALCYAPVPDLGPLRRALEAAASTLGAPYADRAQELALEASIVQALGTHAFAERAALRFPSQDVDFARAWCEAGPGEPAPRHRSDDSRDPQSLVSVMRRAVGELRLPWRVLVSDGMCAAAATGAFVIRIAASRWHRALDVDRIVRHEIEGHALPRHHAEQGERGLLRAGSAGCSDDEEGRAILIEQRAGHLDCVRRAELGRRHLAAQALRSGADFHETARRLVDLGASVEVAVAIALRVYRGGGLGREVVYLPAFVRVSQAFAENPRLEAWFERGRVSVAMARTLQAGERLDAA